MVFFTLIFTILAALGIGSQGYELPPVENCNSDNEFLKPHKTYSCRYDITTRGSHSALSKEDLGYNLTCYPVIKAHGGCHYSMEVESCDGDDLGTSTARYPVYFSMSNGVVESLMAHRKEPMDILNFKRGIISSLLVKNSSETVAKQDYQFQMRTDVQGTCPVHYHKSGSVITMLKRVSGCNFPPKVDWSYSPWSLVWNMSFVQKLGIVSLAHCRYSNEGPRPMAHCREEHGFQLSPSDTIGSSFRTGVTQSITVTSDKQLNKSPDGLISDDYHFVRIQYEHERDAQSGENVKDLREKAVSLLEQLVIEADKPIETSSSERFDELVQLLRNSADLKEMTMELPSCWNSQKCRQHSTSKYGVNDYKVQMAQVWRDALVHCNRLPCLRAFRYLLNMNQDYLEGVITDNYLSLVFLSWVNLNVQRIDYFSEMLEICKLKPSRPCTLSMTSALHTYWLRNRQDFTGGVPEVVRRLVGHVSRPIGSNCEPTQSFTRVQIMTSLTAIANLGEVAELAEPQLLYRLHACATNDKLYWPINILAIQATRRFEPSAILLGHLLTIFKNTAVRQDRRVAAYEVLSKNWGNALLVQAVLTILKDEQENLNLKTFLISTLKTVAKSKNPENAEYANAIRDAMHEDPRPFRLDTHRYVSKYTERSFYIRAPVLGESKRFGYTFAETILRNPETFLPYSLADSLKVELFGKTFDLYNIYGNSRGMMKSYAVFLSYFFNADTLNLTQAVQSVVKAFNILGVRETKGPAMEDFPYHVDKNILQNLLKIRKDQLESLARAFSGEHDAIFTLKLLGDVLGFSTAELLQEDIYEILQSWIVPPFIPTDIPISTSRFKILEADHHVPTLVGFPLTWSLETLLTHSLKENKQVGYRDPHFRYEFSFNSMMTLRARMVLDAPNGHGFGVQTSSALSSSVGSTIKLVHSYADQSFNVTVEIPKRPLQWLSLTRQYSVFRKPTRQEGLPRVRREQAQLHWCSRGLFPYLSTQFCRANSAFQYALPSSSPMLFVGETYNWNLTTELDTKQDKGYELKYEMKRDNDEKWENYGIDLRALDPRISDKFFDLVNYKHHWNKLTDEHQMELRTPKLPHLQLTAVKRLTELSGYKLWAEATILPNRTFAIRYETKTVPEHSPEYVLRHRPSWAFGSKPVQLLPVTYHTLNITTPTEYYSWNYSQRQYPQTHVVDLIFRSHSFLPENAAWLQKAVPNDVFFVDAQTLKLQFHHETHHSADNLSLAILPLLTYSRFETPKTKIELDTFSGSTPFHDRMFTFNLTQHNLSSKELLTFLNFTATANFWNGQFAAYKASLAVPARHLAAGMRFKRESDDYDCQVSLLQEVFQWKTTSGQRLDHTDQIASKLDSIDLDIRLRQNRTLARAASERGRYLVFEVAPYQLLARLSYRDGESAILEYRPEHSLDYSEINHHLLLSSTALRLQWASRFHLDVPASRMSVGSEISQIPDGKPLASYEAAVTTSAEAGLHLEYAFRSLWYQSSGLLQYKLEPGKLIVDFTSMANSTIRALDDMFLQIRVSNNTMRTLFQNHFFDYTFHGNWSNGIRGEFQTKSKNLKWVPNLNGDLEHARGSAAVLRLEFPDIHKSAYLISEVPPHRTERRVTLCLQKRCNNTAAHLESFVGQLSFSILDGVQLETTLAYNERIAFLLKPLLRARFGLKKGNATLLEPLDNFHTRDFTIDHLMTYILRLSEQTAGHLSSKILAVTSDLDPVKAQTVDAIVQASSYLLMESKLAKLLDLAHLYDRYAVKQRISYWGSRGFTSLLLGIFYVPGAKSEVIYSVTVPLPIHGWKFGDLLQPLNPAFFRPVGVVRFWHSPLWGIFRKPRYTRFALFVGQGDIYTFDGRHLRLGHLLGPQCAYLLSHDFESQTFTVYYQDQTLHFLFPAFHMALASDGKLSVNGHPREFPFQFYDSEEVQAVRRETLVEIRTKYSLEVVCEVSGTLMCVFYSNAWKFSQFLGLLGNNNDNPGDDIKGPASHFLKRTIDFNELTGNSQCGKSREGYADRAPSHVTCGAFSSFPQHLGITSPTFLCHDIIPPEGFLELCQNSSTSSCTTVKSYLALCGAHGVPVGHIPTSCVHCDRRSYSMEWTEPVEAIMEVVFLVDQAARGKKFVKGLGLLARNIDEQFHNGGYWEVRFGLVGFRGMGFRHEPEQHTMKSKLMGNVDELVHNGLPNLEFQGPNATSSSVAFRALAYAARHYPLDQRAHHAFILITHEDPTDLIDAAGMHEAKRQLMARQVVLYVFSDYTTTSKQQWAFQTGQTGRPDLDFPKGQYSLLAAETGGALWRLDHLQMDAGGPQRQYLLAVAEDMISRRRQEAKNCRTCTCPVPGYYQAQAVCSTAHCN